MKTNVYSTNGENGVLKSLGPFRILDSDKDKNIDSKKLDGLQEKIIEPLEFGETFICGENIIENSNL